MARPQKPVDAKVVEAMASVGATTEEIGHYCGVSGETIRRRFGDILAKARSNLRTRLRQAQLKLALNGNATMLIWLGKQILNQQERQAIDVGAADDLKAMTVRFVKASVPSSS